MSVFETAYITILVVLFSHFLRRPIHLAMDCWADTAWQAHQYPELAVISAVAARLLTHARDISDAAFHNDSV